MTVAHGFEGTPPPPASVELRATPRRDAAAERRVRQMVVEHFDFIWRCVRGFGVPSGSADDAAQHVFWIAAEKVNDIAPGRERAFLFSTARGVAANFRRAQSRRPELPNEEAVAAGVDRTKGPEDALAEKQARATLDRLLETLSVDLRTVFILFELEGLATAEIAEMLGLPPGTVASRLRRAREEFQAEVKRFQAREGRRP